MPDVPTLHFSHSLLRGTRASTILVFLATIAWDEIYAVLGHFPNQVDNFSSRNHEEIIAVVSDRHKTSCCRRYSTESSYPQLTPLEK